jgi:transcriptional regulator with XRE-family HTH domain
MSTFGECLFEARKRAKLTQEELGQKVIIVGQKKGIDASYISRLERGIYSPPSREVVLGLADALGMGDKRDPNRLQFLAAAGVLSVEDLEGFALVRIEDVGGQPEEKEQVASSLSQLAGLAATGTFGSPSSLVDSPEQQLLTFEEQARQILTSFHLPYHRRMIAQQMGLEAFRLICWGLTEAAE